MATTIIRLKALKAFQQGRTPAERMKRYEGKQ